MITIYIPSVEDEKNPGLATVRQSSPVLIFMISIFYEALHSQYLSSKTTNLSSKSLCFWSVVASVTRCLGSRQADVYETSLPVRSPQRGIQRHLIDIQLLLRQGQSNFDITFQTFCEPFRFLQVVVHELFAFG